MLHPVHCLSIVLHTRHSQILCSQADMEAAEQARLDAAAAKKQAKLERGQGKKKKGGLARMKQGGGLDEDDVAPVAAARAAAGGGSGSDDDDDDGDGSRKDRRKAEKKAAHRAEVADRNEQREAIKEREAELEAKREAKTAEREAREKAREEREREEREAAERRKQEELDKWKDMFTVEEEGEEEAAGEEDEGRLARFVEHMKEQKVSVLEELGGEFGLKTADIINRVRALEAMGHVSGVIDDRGKFIFISREEMQAVAKFVQKRGRVRISTLAQESNKLIDLTPRKREGDDDDDDAEDADGAQTGAS